MKNILVVCIGNICRSPMAEALLKQALPNHTISSAGIGALVGKPADPFSVQLMAEQGIDISEHRAQQVSLDIVGRAELILVMDKEQKTYLDTQYMAARGKVFRLSEAAKTDIPDPYREGIDSFRNAYQLIDVGVQFWVEQILRIA